MEEIRKKFEEMYCLIHNTKNKKEFIPRKLLFTRFNEGYVIKEVNDAFVEFAKNA